MKRYTSLQSSRHPMKERSTKHPCLDAFLTKQEQFPREESQDVREEAQIEQIIIPTKVDRRSYASFVNTLSRLEYVAAYAAVK
jgi:hypothetical protein